MRPLIMENRLPIAAVDIDRPEPVKPPARKRYLDDEVREQGKLVAAPNLALATVEPGMARQLLRPVIQLARPGHEHLCGIVEGKFLHRLSIARLELRIERRALHPMRAKQFPVGRIEIG